MHTLILTWNAILSGAFESPTDDIALGRRGKARDDASKFGNGGSEKDKALGIKVTMSEARLLIGSERQAQSAGFKPRVESDQRPFSHLFQKVKEPGQDLCSQRICQRLMSRDGVGFKKAKFIDYRRW